jgi:formamidopyrimidine-DNA glycosylase
VVPDVRFRPVDARVWWELDGGRGLIYQDPRALGKVHLHRTSGIEELLADVGMEPLSTDFTREWFIETARMKRQPAKLFLMDQRHIAGLGNIYAAEALFQAGVHPGRVISSLSRKRLETLHGAIVRVLTDAVQSACIAYVTPGRFEEAEAFPLHVYDREGEACGTCRRRIRRIQQGGRSTYFCPGCQR